MEIQYYRRSDQYGFGGRMYPIGEMGSLITMLTGRSTLTPRDVRLIKKLGFTLQEVKNMGEVSTSVGGIGTQSLKGNNMPPGMTMGDDV